jgi:superfamily II DNA or RNA helicase
MFDASGSRRKLVIFSEHRDTINYLLTRIATLLGRPDAVVTIHGGLGREERTKAQESFTQDKDVYVLVATDAAGEGINLQRAHLMILRICRGTQPAGATPPHKADGSVPLVEFGGAGDAGRRP